MKCDQPNCQLKMRYVYCDSNSIHYNFKNCAFYDTPISNNVDVVNFKDLDIEEEVLGIGAMVEGDVERIFKLNKEKELK